MFTLGDPLLKQMADSAAFYSGDGQDRVPLYQFGQLFLENPPEKHDDRNVRDKYLEFQNKRESRLVTSKNVTDIGLNSSVKNQDYHAVVHRRSDTDRQVIMSVLRYPLAWIFHCNRPPRRELTHQKKIEHEFFTQVYLADEIQSVSNLTLCEEKKLFRHQKFVAYCLRPYSPIRSLIINSRTGSGKTRMMQAVLDNFACFPNRKIVLFPTAPLREEFYNKTVKPFSTYYILDDKPIQRRIVNKKDGSRYEALDVFNRKYAADAEGEITVNGRYDHPLFRKFYAMTQKKKPLGATLILTYKEFINMSKNPTNIIGGKHFISKEGKFTIKGAMILVDEAHLLFDTTNPSSKKITDGILHILENEEDVHTLGLFSATPFEDLGSITKYKTLLQTAQHGHMQRPEQIARNYMMYYTEAAEHMFNDEIFKYVTVPKSKTLQHRADKLDLDEDRISKHCWFTQFDKRYHQQWDKDLTKEAYKPPTEKHDDWITRNLKDKPIRDQYTFLMSRTYSAADELSALKELYPKLGFAFENIRIQTRLRTARITFWKKCQSLWNGMKGTQDRFSTESYKKFETALEVHQTHNDMTAEKESLTDDFPHIVRKRKADIQGDAPSEKVWEDIMELSLKKAFEDRIVVMMSFTHGLIEMSKLLANNKVPHVILQIENMPKKVIGDHQQVQLCGETLTPEDKSSNGRTYKDDVLVNLVNENTETIPVIIYNTMFPEGISLYNTTQMHILSTDHPYAEVTQMIGRINRMCRTTYNTKTLYMYIFQDSDDESKYVAEVKKRSGWPMLNTAFT
jgi:hypothetical protein